MDFAAFFHNLQAQAFNDILVDGELGKPPQAEQRQIVFKATGKGKPVIVKDEKTTEVMKSTATLKTRSKRTIKRKRFCEESDGEDYLQTSSKRSPQLVQEAVISVEARKISKHKENWDPSSIASPRSQSKQRKSVGRKPVSPKEPITVKITDFELHKKRLSELKAKSARKQHVAKMVAKINKKCGERHRPKIVGFKKVTSILDKEEKLEADKVVVFIDIINRDINEMDQEEFLHFSGLRKVNLFDEHF